MKPFNLEEAKAGKPVCTRDGRAARILCFDMVGTEYPLAALVTNKGSGDETIFTYGVVDGSINKLPSNALDLMMATTTKSKTVYLNLYTNGANAVHSREDDALLMSAAPSSAALVRAYPVTIEWEE
jgi:hypothetical protein